MIDLRNLNVMVVDDNDFERDLIAKNLENINVGQVISVGSGQAALTELAKGGRVDALLCDLKMPDFDGVQLLRKIAESYPDVAVIIISVLDDRLRGSVERMAKEHAVHIIGNLGKPITSDKLLPLLQKIPPRTVADHIAGAGMDLPEFSRSDIAEALNNGEFYLHFQPAVRVADRKPVGAEALLRWQHPVLGNISPDSFIPIAEEAGIIDEITYEILKLAAGSCRCWNDAGLDLRVSVNVSAKTLHVLNLPERIHEIVEQNGLRNNQIIVEITESGFMQELGKTLDVSSRLRIRGIELSIDDFGTGYSSLQQLERIPFNELKIDREFLSNTPEARTILEASIRLGRELGLSTVVEGVETQDHWDIVAGLGGDIAQGYFIGRPMEPEAIPRWHEAWLAKVTP